MLAVGDLEAAAQACDELGSFAGNQANEEFEAIAAQARSAVELARGDAHAALLGLRVAGQIWQRLEAPYETARVRELVGHACRELGDEDTARLELEAARDAFAALGAATDLARVDLLLEVATSASGSHGLTDREVEVIRLVAAGKTNRQVATELVISEHTAARHLQNIYAKLGISSRTAASAFAFEHRLV